MNQKEQLAQGKGKSIEVIGEAHILQIFEISEGGGRKKGANSKTVQVAGSRVQEGEVNNKQKYRLVREGEILISDLTIASLKTYKKDTAKVAKGAECGI